MVKKYNQELLDECMTRDGATLVGEYENLTVRTRIYFICKCGEKNNKEFRKITDIGKVCCPKCEYEKKSETKKFNQNFLIECIERDGATLIGEYEKINRECDINYKCKCGVESVKNFRLIVENGGAFCDDCRVKNTVKKRGETNMKIYGHINPLQNEEVRKKGEETNLVKYGCKNVFQNEEIKEKIKETHMKTHGVDNLAKTDEVKKKIKKTFLERYGTENIQELDEIKDKIKETNLKKYGFEHNSQNPEIHSKMTKSAFSTKNFMFPSGYIIDIQGYEHFALDELIDNEHLDENNIKTGSKNVPKIWYIGEDGKNHRHYVDIFIPSQNKCIEVKSTWTAKLHAKDIFLKQEAGKKLGYEYEIWIYDSKGNKVECHK
jgi:hypothetical protein